MTTKAKVYQRLEEPPRMRSTDRDLRILQTVAAFRFVSGDQIERLIFTQGEEGEKKKTRCPARLRKLFDNRLLGRVRWPFNAITLPMIYYLEKGGADLLALKHGVEREQIRTTTKNEKRPVISRSLLFLAHTLAVNDFRIDVTRAAERNGWALPTWLNEYELGREYADIEFDGRRSRQAVQPDGYFVIKPRDVESHFFLEMDMETTPSRRWASKVLGLYEYRFRGRYTERFGTKNLRVLCMTPSESRQQLLIQWTKEVIPVEWHRLFWFTTQDKVRVEDVLSSPIWQVVGEPDQQRRPIFDTL